MSVELIYRTESAEAVAWAKEFIAGQQKLNSDWNTLIDDLTVAYGPVGDGRRLVQIRDGFIVGFLPAFDGEDAPAGWMFRTEWGAFVPDVLTAIGASWQHRLDELPRAETTNSPTIGMPAQITVIAHDMVRVDTVMSVFIPADQLSVYALWETRDVKPFVDAAIAQTPRHGWSEVPRSAWYAFLEAGSAQS